MIVSQHAVVCVCVTVPDRTYPSHHLRPLWARHKKREHAMYVLLETNISNVTVSFCSYGTRKLRMAVAFNGCVTPAIKIVKRLTGNRA